MRQMVFRFSNIEDLGAYEDLFMCPEISVLSIKMNSQVEDLQVEYQPEANYT